jgi:hypothetical protein
VEATDAKRLVVEAVTNATKVAVALVNLEFTAKRSVEDAFTVVPLVAKKLVVVALSITPLVI